MPGSCPQCVTVTEAPGYIMPPGFTATTPIAASFPGQSQYDSFDRRYSIVGVDKDTEPRHTLFLLDQSHVEGRRLLSYDRHVSLLWSSDNRFFAVTDYPAEGGSRCTVLSVDDKAPPIPVLDLLVRQETGSRARTLRRYLRNEYVAVEALQWRGPNKLLLKVSGHGRADRNGFAEVYVVDAYDARR